MNISWFVYRDVNRNGIYDTGDRPYSGLRVQLSRPDGTKVFRNSNINGFANFKMSNNPKKGVIHYAGKYKFSAVVPSSWEVTSSHTTKEIEFAYLEGSPGGIIAKSVLKPIGIAPVPSIQGYIHDQQGNCSLEATSPSGKTKEIRMDPQGQFEVKGEPGTWTLNLDRDNTRQRITRKVSAFYYPQVLAKSFFDEPAEPKKHKKVLVDFDDLILTKEILEIPNGYRGLQWGNWVATHNKYYGGAGYVNTTVSSEFIAYNSSGHPATISRQKPFDFIGSYIGVAWPKADHGKIHIRGFRGTEPVYHDIISVNHLTPVYFHADYRNITSIRIYSDIYWQVVLDDCLFRLP